MASLFFRPKTVLLPVEKIVPAEKVVLLDKCNFLWCWHGQTDTLPVVVAGGAAAAMLALYR